MLSWVGIDQPMKMREISRVVDKKPQVNNRLNIIIGIVLIIPNNTPLLFSPTLQIRDTTTDEITHIITETAEK